MPGGGMAPGGRRRGPPSRCDFIPCPAAIADDETAEVQPDKLLDQLGTIHAHHGRMDGEALRRLNR